MFVSILVCALLCSSAFAITLPNGFTFDETKYLIKNLESRVNVAVEKCERPMDGCASDCSTQLDCDGNSNIIETYPCTYQPYCVRGAGYYSTCSGNFPMNNQACLTKATNSFICSEDGQFPDPTDCAKYHICNGTTHTISECASNSHFTYDRNNVDPYASPGNGEFSCRFMLDQESCMCDRFYCDGMANSFTFRNRDYFHYAYCLDLGTMTKTVMFKCPPGTRHYGYTNAVGSLDCVPIDAPPV